MKLRLSKSKILFVLSFFILGISVSTIQAQKKNSKKNKKEQNDTLKTIKKITEKSKKIEGLFTMYQDTVTGKTHMLITKNQIGEEFIYFSQINNGISDVGRMIKGTYLSSKIFTIEKHFDELNFIIKNTSYYFDPENLLSKSANSNINESIIASIKIAAKNSNTGEFLINSDDLFLKETFTQVKPPKNPKSPPTKFKLGKLNKEKSKIDAIKNYPSNINITTNYVYTNEAVFNNTSKAVTDGRNVSIKIDHSLIAIPKNDYKIRLDDPRIGYFLTEINDQTSTKATPYRDLIHRWNLVKKDSKTTLSEPKEPIVWWIENTTPVQFRETIKEGVLEWNKAFEKAGFKNALVVKIQPNNSEWDAGDIKYNVLRWTSSPNPRFGGYGPSFVNPRTGQILGADIMLEFIHYTNRVKYDGIFNISDNSNNSLIEEENEFNHNLYCSNGHEIHNGLLLGQTVLLNSEDDEKKLEGLRLEAMKSLVMHEIGHTLGLNHNMKASNLFSPEELASPEVIKNKSLSGSIMDYPAINVTLDRTRQGQYYSKTIGPYDIWAIEYGYSQLNKNELNTIANKSIQPELTFGNDADDMRSPGKSIDPRVMTGDLSNDQITYSIDRIKLINNLTLELKDKFNKSGQSYQELKQSFEILRREYGRAGDIISRFIGGVYVDRSMIGQSKNLKPYTPVSLTDQKRAMSALSEYIFSPKAFSAPNDLYNYLAMQRRGFNFRREPEDPKIHNLVLSYQKNILAHLLHKNTLQRISDSELYGNSYKLSEFMTDLNIAIFKADAQSTANTFRQNLQVAYIKKLIDIVKSEPSKKNISNYSSLSKAMSLYNLKEIVKLISNNAGDIQTKAHKNYLKVVIKNTIDNL